MWAIITAAAMVVLKYGADWFYIASYLLTKPFKPPPITKATLVVEVAGLTEKNPYSGEYESIYFD
jgi:hypothetical protein